METLKEKIEKLPPELKQEVIDFIDFLLEKRKKRTTGKLTLSWKGKLKEYRDQYTSLELQKKAMEWID
ncbi:DUF2281 domain-containing protein [Thermodesulfovibrio yellowstonii]|uniref:XRE family transcriptional regulator n=1 Tax=Thermodesulfovibrio yellowstonii TaxID=28262 RepID=A0A9W6GGT0_9BACT|nr:DUF2281 domain-containing protein [Thermodesulfovibrio islandicus]GLI53728.1 XRE family transcriptional regulator [Thermodesulfovibrio islandicus]